MAISMNSRETGMRNMNIMAKGLLSGFFTLVFLVFMSPGWLGPQEAMAAARTASVTGNWSNTATWGGSAVPVAGDTVTINSGITVTLDANTAAIASLTISAMAATGTNGLTVGTFTLNTGSISITGSATNGRNSSVTVSTGTINCTGGITFAGTANQARLTFSGAGTLNLGGNLGTGGTFTASTGTVNYNASAAQTVGAYSYNNLTFSGSGAKTMATGTAVTNVLSIATTGSATADITAGLNLTVSRLTLGGLGRVNGTWGSTSSAATNKNNTFFTATTGRLTITNDTRTASSVTGSPTGSVITYGAALSASTLSGGSATPAGGTFAWTTPATVPAAGTTTAGVTYTPADLTSYTTSTGTGNITVNQRSVTLTGSRSYDTTTAAAAGILSITNKVGADSVTVASGSATLASANVGTQSISSMGTLALGGTAAGNYTLSGASGSVTISMVNQAIVTVTAPGGATYGQTGLSVTASGGSGTGAYSYNATGSTACTVNAASGAITITSGTGSCSITATRAADSNYNVSAASAPATVPISKADQTIGAIIFTPTTLIISGTTTASAAASSTLAVSFSSDTPAICTVSGSTVTGVTAGSCTVRASQAGDGNYNVALDVTQPLTVTSGNVTLTITVAGAGTGTVYSAPGAISCASGSGTGCSDAFTNPTDVTLTAAPDWKSETVWTGGCIGTGNTCGPFTLNGDAGVTATFNYKPLVMMPGPLYYATIQDAYNACVEGTVLKGRDQTFTEDLVFDKTANVTFEGGNNAAWTVVGDTTIHGSVTMGGVSGGSVTISNMIIL